MYYLYAVARNDRLCNNFHYGCSLVFSFSVFALPSVSSFEALKTNPWLHCISRVVRQVLCWLLVLLYFPSQVPDLPKELTWPFNFLL